MKKLTIIRHAKSSWEETHLGDFDRPLNHRGKKDAPAMGRHLLSLGEAPDLMLISTAKRARKTAGKIAAELHLPTPSQRFDERIYGASWTTLVNLVRETDRAVSHLALVGHNPGMHELIHVLAGHGPERFVTCGVARVDLKIDSWADAEPGCGNFVDYFYPKML